MNSSLHPSDPQQLRSRWMLRAFSYLLTRQMQRSFDALRLLKPGLPMLDSARPVVLYCNHPSWWDAAFLAVLATRLFPQRCGYGPIDAAALQRYRFMARIGFFGIEPTAQGARDWLRIGRALLQQPDTLLLVTPEGSFTDPRVRPLSLRPGLAALLARAPHAQVLPLALDYPFWTERQPEALAAFGPPLDWRSLHDADAVQKQLTKQLTQTLDQLTQAACSKDETRFITLLQGRAGVGGVYERWQRLRAAVRGERFEAAHRAVRRQGG